jgi:hypothetical protein
MKCVCCVVVIELVSIIGLVETLRSATSQQITLVFSLKQLIIMAFQHTDKLLVLRNLGNSDDT